MKESDDNNGQNELSKAGGSQSESAENSPIEKLTAAVKSLQESVDAIRHNQDEQNKKLHEKQEKLLEMFEKQKETKKVEIQIPAHDKCSGFDFWKKKSTTPISGKEFVLKHVFKNVSSMEEGDHYCSEVEEHFGVPWKSYVVREKEYIEFYLHCLRERKGKEEWSIETWRDMRMFSETGKVHSVSDECVFKSTDKGHGWGWDFLKWDELVKDYVTDDSITAEIHVKIKKMSGISKKDLRNFDESNESFADVILIVGDEKFYISKLFLANHSTYFKTLFLGQFQESQKGEISLSGIDSDDFQNYLEVLYGYSGVDETTVEGILLIADMYDTQIVVRKCVNFLIRKSKKSMKKKLQLATRYNLDKLKKKCLSEINTVDEIKAVIPSYICDMDHSLMANLLEKALAPQS